MIHSVCVYLIKKDAWLMLCRNKKKHDVNHDKWIGVGGKIEPGETPQQCAHREVLEETGLTMDDLQLQGTVLFHSEKAQDEKIWIYTSKQFHGEMHEDDEGTLAWIHTEDLLSLPLWQGDKIFMKRMLQGNVPFSYEFSYDRDGNLRINKEECFDE